MVTKKNAAGDSPEQAPDEAEAPKVELRGEPGPEVELPPGSGSVVKSSTFIRPKPKYCARPNCGLRPQPGSKTCAHHRGWTA